MLLSLVGIAGSETVEI
uniref:Uncharacterized protein n=1 Tax=Anguilla anguilla TaxID=7936 RepID=A0A0E9W348_ANGAN